MNKLIERLKKYQPLFGSWELDTFIAKGASSYVFKIKQSLSNETIYSAVKVISINFDDENALSQDAKFRSILDKKQYAENEIINMYKLKSCPYIVHCNNYEIKDIFDESGKCIGFDILIQMNYYTCLTKYLSDNDIILDENEIIKIARQIGIALKAAHDNGILHRDIKPDNIFIDDEGNYLLGDLGVSKQLNANVSFHTVTGTEPYIAPEQITLKNRRHIKTSDIYSFGIVLYTLLNNNFLPFVDNSSSLSDIKHAIQKRINGAKIPPPKNGSEEFQRIVLKSCQFDPKMRYQTIDNFLADIYAITGNNTAELKTKPNKFPTSAKVIAISVALILLILGAIAFGIKSSSKPANNPVIVTSTTSTTQTTNTTTTTTTTTTETKSDKKTTTKTKAVKKPKLTTKQSNYNPITTRQTAAKKTTTNKPTTTTTQKTTTAETYPTITETEPPATTNPPIIVDNKEDIDGVL